ncbi:hypothetical protein HDV00_003429 [Rhizophlyctis rosea]|nr:hypothetical protein HDV00_003429 [Rhizophlyctis rosea]
MSDFVKHYRLLGIPGAEDVDANFLQQKFRNEPINDGDFLVTPSVFAVATKGYFDHPSPLAICRLLSIESQCNRAPTSADQLSFILFASSSAQPINDIHSLICHYDRKASFNSPQASFWVEFMDEFDFDGVSLCAKHIAQADIDLTSSDGLWQSVFDGIARKAWSYTISWAEGMRISLMSEGRLDGLTVEDTDECFLAVYTGEDDGVDGMTALRAFLKCSIAFWIGSVFHEVCSDRTNASPWYRAAARKGLLPALCIASSGLFGGVLVQDEMMVADGEAQLLVADWFWCGNKCERNEGVGLEWYRRSGGSQITDATQCISDIGKSDLKPIHVAARNGRTAITEVLLASNSATLGTLTKDESTALHIGAQHGQGKAVAFLASRAALVDAKNQHQCTPLHLAASNGHADTFRVLVGLEAEIDAHNFDGHTPLHLAALKGHVDVVRVLWNNGASGTILESVDPTPLHLAASAGHVDVVNSLLAKDALMEAPCRMCGEEGMTHLHVAAYHGQTEVVIALLVEQTRRANNGTTHEDKSRAMTPLHYAAERGHVDVVRALVESGVFIDAVNSYGKWTPLGGAAMNDRIEIMELLLAAGACLDGRGDGLTPLHCAADGGRLRAAKLLLAEGAKVDAVDFDKRTPLHVATCEAVATLLLEKGASVSAKDKQGRTPLHYAVRLGYYQGPAIAEVLIQWGADVGARDKRNKTPLHLAVEGRVDGMQTLITHGAAVDVTDDEGKTPLWLASHRDMKESVKFLLDSGARTDIASNDGSTPLAVAEKRGFTEIANLLQERESVFQSVRRRFGL